MSRGRTAPGTWDRNRKGEIFCDRYTILTVQDPFEFDGPGEIGEQDANAAFIVLADHHFDAMEKALREALLQLEYLQGRFQTGTTPPVILRVAAVINAIDEERKS